MSKNYLNQRNKVEDFLFKSKFDYENQPIRLSKSTPAGGGYGYRAVWQSRRLNELFVAEETKDLMCGCCVIQVCRDKLGW